MSQSPYTPPGSPYPSHYPNYYPQQSDPLAPARRASSLMYIIGGLVIAGGLCCVGFSPMVPKAIQEQPDAFRPLQAANPMMTPQFIKTVVLVMGIVVVLVGGAMVALGR